MNASIQEVFAWKAKERLPISPLDGYKYSRKDLVIRFGDTSLFARRKKHKLA